jgi:acetyl esterase/lipase
LYDNAEKYGIDKKRFALMGFSAGGHLASTLATHYNKTMAGVSETSAKPDFLILIYPVITFSNEQFVHEGSRYHFLGDEYFENNDFRSRFSNELQADSTTAPAFLVHTSDDVAVPSMNSVLFYEALNKHGINAEMHIFPEGGHGFGMAEQHPALSSWPELLKTWLINLPGNNQ